MNTPNRPVKLMILAQMICVAVMLCTAGLLVCLMTYFAIALMAGDTNYLPEALRTLILGGSLVWVEVEALSLCERMKHASAFSDRNVRALGRIAAVLMIGGLTALLFGNYATAMALGGLPTVHPAVEHLLLPFILLTVAAMVRAVQLLMRHALTMQEENDLTV